MRVHVHATWDIVLCSGGVRSGGVPVPLVPHPLVLAALLTSSLQPVHIEFGCARCRDDPLFMAQIISSAIVNAPPPHPVVKMLMRTNFACELVSLVLCLRAAMKALL